MLARWLQQQREARMEQRKGGASAIERDLDARQARSLFIERVAQMRWRNRGEVKDPECVTILIDWDRLGQGSEKD